MNERIQVNDMKKNSTQLGRFNTVRKLCIKNCEELKFRTSENR